MNTLKTFLLAGALLAGAGAAQAADYLPVDLPPVYSEVPELAPVEIGNGWYLRGNVSYDLETEFDADHRSYRPASMRYDEGQGLGGSYSFSDRYDSFDNGSRSWDLDAGVDVGAGVGYQFSDLFRGDLTVNYWKHDISSDAGPVGGCAAFGATAYDFDPAELDCSESSSGTLKAWEIMANAYVDLGTFAGFSPYVGAGAGAVHLDYDGVTTNRSCSYAGKNCDIPLFADSTSHDDVDDWRFAYSLMAGIGYDLTQTVKLDLGYRYLNVDGGDMVDFGSNGSGVAMVDDGFDRHTFQAGLRYSLF